MIGNLENKTIEELKRLKEEILKKKDYYETDIVYIKKALDDNKLDYMMKKDFDDEIRDDKIALSGCDADLREVENELKRRLV